MEFMGLANRNEEFKAEIARYAEMLRAAQLEALPGILDRYGRTAGPLSLEVLTFLLTAISRVMVTEQLIGMSLGHAAILALVHQYLRDLEGDPKTWQPRRLTVSREEKP